MLSYYVEAKDVSKDPGAFKCTHDRNILSPELQIWIHLVLANMFRIHLVLVELLQLGQAQPRFGAPF